jgi:hypothetical protein
MMELAIAHDYRGLPLPAADCARVLLAREPACLRIEVDAPYFGDPAPAGPAGPTDRLWEHEVVEVFIADAAQHYLEVELSPHGHHLVLELSGVRHILRGQLPIDYYATITPPTPQTLGHARSRFQGVARLPWAYLPQAATRVNAYAIHGQGAQRCYHAHSPPCAVGEAPDFHRLACFVPWAFAP